MRNVLFACVASVCLGVALSAPSLVLTSPGPPTPVPENFSGNYEGKEGQENEEKADQQPIIYQFDINSNISNRFAKTLVTSKVKNPENKAKEAVFTVVLPEKAFISEFVMIIDGKSYKAYVKEKEEAKNIYDNAVQSGISAAHVAVSARDSNRFTVSLNIEPEAKATFLLTYEELLERKNNQYELVLNIHPGQVVKDLNIEVFVNESRPLKYVRTPSLRSGNEISKNDDSLNPSSDIQIVDRTSAVVRFKPDADRQKGFAKGLGGKENEGLAGQFVLQYDVERDPQKGEVLLKDGYFVHFFAPEDLEPLPKHVVFVLDTSGSMYGTKLKQMKDAMSSILGELKESDTFHIVEFNTNIYVWNIDTENRIKVDITNEREPFEDLLKTKLPSAVPASKEAVAKGKSVIAKLQDEGITNMLSSLETALHLVRMDLKKDAKHNQPIIIFLTDGEPTMGISDPEEITKIVTRHNTEKNQVPIFSLSFGDGADKKFLRKLSLKNLGFSRHIYEAADASLQLQEFYRQISSPLLSNIEFEYTDNVTEVSKKIFPIYFRGSELVVAGKYDEGFAPRNWPVRCGTFGGIKSIQSLPEAPVSSLERLWAYLTIKQKLEERDVAENKSVLTKQALDLALKYSFVTDVSSLVVVKPNATSAVDTEDASRPGPVADTARGGFGGAMYAAPISAPSSFKQLSYTGFSRTSLRQFKRPLIMYDPPPQAVQSSGNLLVPQTKIYGPGYAAAGTLPYKCTDSVCTTPAAPFHFNAPTTVPVSPVPIPAPGSPLRASLPWLSNVIHSNETISILGGEYELGENKFVMPSVECPKTPLNSTESGECNILSQCRQVHSYLTDFQTYEKFACIVDNRYAGVCCPKIMYMM